MKRYSLPIHTADRLSAANLFDAYVTKKFSVAQIARTLKCSENRVNYWLAKHKIQKRTISDAMYHLKNPLGDPFLLKQPKTLEQGILFGMGLGLYWGEGSKRGTGGVRLTNTDARLLRKFIEFLETIFGIERKRLRFSIQIFSDISPEKAISYWQRELNVGKEQFYKIVISKVRGKGTYKYKSEYGVAIVYFNNIRLKRLICEMIENIR